MKMLRRPASAASSMRFPFKIESTVAAPWNILIKQIGLKNSTLNFSDRSDAITRSHTLSDINLDLETLTWKENEPASVKLSALLDTRGQINAGGTLTLSPFSMALSCRLGNIQLSPFSEYLEAVSFLKIDKGSLAADGSASLSAGAASSLTAKLNLDLTDLQVKDTRTGGALFGLEAFLLKDIKVDTGEKKVSIASAALVKPEVFVERSKEKKMNLVGLTKPEPTKRPGSMEAPVGRFPSKS